LNLFLLSLNSQFDPFKEIPFLIHLPVEASNDEGWMALAVYALSFAQIDAFLIGCLIANFEGDIRKQPSIAYALLGIGALIAIKYMRRYMWVSIVRAAQEVSTWFAISFRGFYAVNSERPLYTRSLVYAISAAADYSSLRLGVSGIDWANILWQVSLSCACIMACGRTFHRRIGWQPLRSGPHKLVYGSLGDNLCGGVYFIHPIRKTYHGLGTTDAKYRGTHCCAVD
jgi:hypothetical protein